MMQMVWIWNGQKVWTISQPVIGIMVVLNLIQCHIMLLAAQFVFYIFNMVNTSNFAVVCAKFFPLSLVSFLRMSFRC